MLGAIVVVVGIGSAGRLAWQVEGEEVAERGRAGRSCRHWDAGNAVTRLMGAKAMLGLGGNFNPWKLVKEVGVGQFFICWAADSQEGEEASQQTNQSSRETFLSGDNPQKNVPSSVFFRPDQV